MANLLEKLEQHLADWDFVSLTQELEKAENGQWIENNTWDLIPLLIDPATSEHVRTCPQLINTCSKLLAEKVAVIGKPKEVLISLIEQCEHYKDIVKLKHCLPALNTSLLRLDLKAASLTWDWALAVIVEQVANQELPVLPELEGKERMTLDEDKVYFELVESVLEVTNLLESLKNKLLGDFPAAASSAANEDEGKRNLCRGHLIWASIRLMSQPLSVLNTTELDDFKPAARVALDKLTMILVDFTVNPVQIMEFKEFCNNYSKRKLFTDEDDAHVLELEQQWSVGNGVYYQSLIELQMLARVLPMCYDHIFLFHANLKAILLMVKFNLGDAASYYLRVEKGLKLAMALISKLPKKCLSADRLDMQKHTDLITSLHQVLVFNGVKEVRQLAYKVYDAYYDLFDAAGIYRLSLMVLDKANHSGLIGHTIGKLKNVLVANLNLNDKDSSEALSGLKLQRLVMKFCHLSNGPETDLLEVSDEVMASLNFLVCIFLRDKEDRLGLGVLKTDLKTDYLKPLAEGLAFSRAHYKEKLTDSEFNKNNNVDQTGSDVTVTVGGQPLPEMTSQQLKEVITSALNTFDMMECVLSQLNDILGQ